MDAPLVPEVAGLVALALVLWAIVAVIKYFHGHKSLGHEKALLKMTSDNSNILIEAITLLREINRRLNNK